MDSLHAQVVEVTNLHFANEDLHARISRMEEDMRINGDLLTSALDAQVKAEE